MKVLMFGWEFPPHISGGLGTACYGLTEGLSKLDNLEVIFVVPKAFGDEDQTNINLIGANQVSVKKAKYRFKQTENQVDLVEIDSELIPYISEEEFWKQKAKKLPKHVKFVKTADGETIEFTGEYGPGLLDEIRKYALVAEIIAQENKFDIIHAHDWLAYPAGIAAKKTTGKPLVIHVHATDFDRSGGNVNPNVYAIERDGMEQADHIITVSNFTRNTVIEKYQISPKKITTVYNAVTPSEAIKLNEIEKRPNEKIVTFLGRITLQKGPEYFIEAANMVIKKMNNVKFVMAGSGDLMDSMINRVAELGIADRFHFTGFLEGNDVYQMFKLTDVFVMPSVSEPFGIVPLEAMQTGVPVIISNQSGVSEILENAIKIDFWDTFAMADSIFGLLNYSSLSEHFRQEGKTEVEKLTWTNSAQNVKAVYNKLLQN